MAGLVDVNVLIALVLPIHVHHAVARRWLEDEGEYDGWATCALSELGAIRVCAQLPAPQTPRATAEAIALLRRAAVRHTFWSDISPVLLDEVRGAATGPQVSDRYLLGLARRHGGRLVTFDRGAAAAGGADVVCLAPPR